MVHLVCGGLVLVAAFGALPPRGSMDFDADGYVGKADLVAFLACFGGPGGSPPKGCSVEADENGDSHVDLADFAFFQRSRGHLPIPLKDSLGSAITINSTAPYDGRRTCGGCHDVDRITNGFLFQQGRTDTSGQIEMRDDYYADGRFWIKSSGRYGKWGQSFRYLLAAKENASPSNMDQTAFAWVRDCGGCHPGGGPGEFDRDGELLYDETAGKFGYERLGKTADEVALDGDYTVLNYTTGEVTLSPWNVTGLSGPDCLRCHRTQRTVRSGNDMNFIWRRDVLAAGATLVDESGATVPAFAAAATAGQGWFSRIDIAARPPVLQIDYAVGVQDGSLLADDDARACLSPVSVTWPPKDRACWGCHPFGTITGTVWFDDRDVLYRYFNRLSDDNPANDISPENSRVCTVCHIGDVSHNFGRGNSLQIHYRDELDWTNLRDCRSCHITTLPSGEPNPFKHPDAPEYPGQVTIHLKMDSPGETQMRLSCQACHIPYALAPALLFRDITIPGATGTTSQYLSADPLDPSNPDKSRWYSAFAWKTDADGLERLFPVNLWITIYWGDWKRNGTPDDLSDDIIAPIPTWRVSQVIPVPLSVVTDDNGDGQLEINRPEEILEYIRLLRGNDALGVPVALNPVLVKGPRIWYEDSDSAGSVTSFDHRGTGIPITSYPYVWELDHNVRPVAESLGYAPNHGPEGCRDCHRPATHDAPVWDRLVLVDPFGPDGAPVYEKVRTMTGLNPP